MKYCALVLTVLLCFMHYYVIVVTEEMPQKTDEGRVSSQTPDTGFKGNIQEWKPYEKAVRSEEIGDGTTTQTKWIGLEGSKPRRIRKRKRIRPLIVSEESPLMVPPEPPIDPLWAMETSTRQNNRRRLTPDFTQTTEEEPFPINVEAKDSPNKNTDEKSRIRFDTAPVLRTILRQNGPLSLSELLQQKNLSLSQLLQGGAEVISALTEPPPTNPIKKTSTTQKHLQKDVLLEMQKKRQNLFRTPTQNVTKKPTVEESAKRILVPFVGKYTTINFLPSFYKSTKNTHSTTTVSPLVQFKAKLPITSAKLNKVQTKLQNTSVTSLPEKAVKINFGEMFAFKKANTKIEEDEDEPYKMSLDLDKETSTFEVTTRKIYVSEKMKPITAKDEILDVLQDPISRNNLARILKKRNMTIMQLVAQRERGSSQIHLADIFHNETREPEPSLDAIIHPGYLDIPVIEGKFHETTVPEPKPVLESGRAFPTISIARDPVTVTSFPTYKIVMDPVPERKQPKVNEAWENSINSVYEGQGGFEEGKSLKTYREPDVLRTSNVREIFNGDDVDEGFFGSLPTGVRSAIIASFAIIGLSLFVFLTILCIFKISQKRKVTLGYCGSFSGSRIKSPILANEMPPRSTLRSLMTDTLSRKKKYYKSHFHTMPDNIWDTSHKNNYM